MKQPNAACAGFCNWMLNISKQRLSGPQRTIVQDVYTAAVAVTPVSDQTWYNFNLFSAWRNKFYEIYRDYAKTVTDQLLIDLIGAWNMDGNSLAAYGAFDFAQNVVSFSPAFGKIDQGVSLDTPLSYLETSGNPNIPVWSVNFWAHIPALITGLNSIMANYTTGDRLRVNPGTGKWEIFINGVTSVGTVAALGIYQMVTVTSDGSFLNVYVNKTKIIGPVTAPTMWELNTVGFYSGPNSAMYYSDCWANWARELDSSDINLLYNSGAGVQYPF